MRRFNLPPQIVRLVLLTIGIVGSYMVARYFLTPESFGQYGWYRGDALIEQSSLPRSYGGRNACNECHSEKLAQLAKYPHKTLSCEVCHGPCQPHIDNPDEKNHQPEKPGFSHCVRCHETNPSRPKWLKQVSIRDHYAGQKCTECHIPHAPTEVP